MVLSGLSDIERRFIDRTASPEEEHSIMQALPAQRWQVLVYRRDRRDLEKEWADLARGLPDVLHNLRATAPASGPLPAEELARRLAAGLAFLIEEIHHLNACAAFRRRNK